MYQLPFRKKKGILKLSALLAALSMFTACTAGTDCDTCNKCIDNKPAPTPFVTTLNAINHHITLNDAADMISNFGTAREGMLTTGEGSPASLPIYETFNLKAIDSLICQPGVVGFRVYLALDGQNQVRYVLTGVDGEGKDVIQRRQENPAHVAAADEMILEAGQRWP
ncbi:MAG TPA: hypothetical protein VIN07_12415 [Flavipsychrobacter sp.]